MAYKWGLDPTTEPNWDPILQVVWYKLEGTDFSSQLQYLRIQKSARLARSSNWTSGHLQGRLNKNSQNPMVD